MNCFNNFFMEKIFYNRIILQLILFLMKTLNKGNNFALWDLLGDPYMSSNLKSTSTYWYTQWKSFISTFLDNSIIIVLTKRLKQCVYKQKRAFFGKSGKNVPEDWFFDFLGQIWLFCTIKDSIYPRKFVSCPIQNFCRKLLSIAHC